MFLQRFFIIALALAVGYGIYEYSTYKSPAYLSYLAFTHATLEGDCKTLDALSEGDARKWVEAFCGPTAAMTVMGQVVSGQSAAGIVSDLRNTPQGMGRGLQHELKSEEKADDGTVSLVVIESVLQRPSNFSKPAPPRQHDVKVKEFDGVWKVIEYKEKDI